jgi:hypothetical protein
MSDRLLIHMLRTFDLIHWSRATLPCPSSSLIMTLAAVISKTFSMQSCACSMQCRPCWDALNVLVMPSNLNTRNLLPCLLFQVM